MAWEEDVFALLDDLEAQAAAAYDADRVVELADRSRAEYQQVTLASRWMASTGCKVSAELRGVGQVDGVLDRVAAQWCVLRGPAQDWVVRLAAVVAVTGLSPRSLPEVAWSPLSRLGIGSPLRRLAAAGERCVLHTESGRRLDGVPGRVGADFVEVAVGEDRRISVVPFATLSAVQSRD